jgi:glycosyltransferase involved in cell wall biosynthesis
MLVYNDVEHDARVRRSARAIADAGLRVIVLGIRPNGARETRSWHGFELRLVRRRNSLREHEARVRERATEARSHLERVGRRLERLQGAARTAGPVGRLSARARARVYRHLRSRAKLRDARAQEALAEARATRGACVADDPLALASYEETWWPFVRRLRPDVVHVHDPHGLLVAQRAAARGARWIYDAHEDPLKKATGGEKRSAAVGDRLGELARQADAVITVSAPLADRLARAFDLSERPVVVHNTPSLATAGAAPDPGLREQAGVGPDTPLVVYAGSMTRWRRLSVVVEALRLLPEVNLALVVSRENKFVLETMERAREQGVSERVHLVPKVPPESLVAFLREADVGVHPLARYPNAEIALPNKIFEYLHAGLPMVVSDCAAMADFVLLHGLGEVAPVDDPRAWADAIERVLHASPYRERVEEWDALKREWSWERQAEELIRVYRRVLGPSFPRASG